MISNLKLKDVCSFVPGAQPPKSDFIHEEKEGYVRLIQIRDRLNDNFITFIPKSSTNKFVEKHEILVGRYGPPIFQVFRGFEGAYNVAIMKAIPLNGTDNDFLYYYLLQKGLLHYVESMSFRTAGQTGVQLDSLYEYPVLIAEHEEQAKVATTLKRLDDKIALNNSIIKTLNNVMREYYDYWFIQFDFPNENGRPYKASGGDMIYNESIKRKIPKGWKVQNLLKNDLCKDIKPGIDKFNGAKTYYATADVMGDEIGAGTQIYYDNRESRANMQPKPNSVWFTKMKNSAKHMTILPTSDDLLGKSIFSTGFFGLECSFETLPYIRSFVYSDYFEKVKDLNSNGATMEAISNDGVRNIKLIIPDEKTLKKYSDITNACLSQIDILRKENAKLSSLRDWLLPMLMNGQAKITGDS